MHGDLRAELLRDRGYGLWYEGEREAGYGLVLDALEHVRDPELAARTHAAAAWLWHDGDLDRAIWEATRRELERTQDHLLVLGRGPARRWQRQQGGSGEEADQ